MKLDWKKLLLHAGAAFVAVFSATYATTHNVGGAIVAGLIAAAKDIWSFVTNPLKPVN